MVLKNNIHGKIIENRIIDINKIYHYIHGKNKTDDIIVNIKNSPTVGYLLGDINGYVKRPRSFAPRVNSFPFLIDLYNKGEWLDIFVYHHRDIYIVVDGMHRSSILYHNKLENVKVVLINRHPFRNKDIDAMIQAP